MLKGLSRPLVLRHERVTLAVFTVLYGQHVIGIARARGAEEAMHVIEAFFLGDIEPERLTAKEATVEEKVQLVGRLSEGDEDSVVGMLV